MRMDEFRVLPPRLGSRRMMTGLIGVLDEPVPVHVREQGGEMRDVDGRAVSRWLNRVRRAKPANSGDSVHLGRMMFGWCGWKPADW